MKAKRIMKGGLVLGILCAIALHVGVIFFGGLVFNVQEHKKAKIQEVELMGEEAEEEKKKEPEPEPEEPEEIDTQNEPPPDASEMIKNIDLTPAESAPALEAASLSAIEAALGGYGGGGDFGESLSFASGGRIGGKGKGGAAQSFEDAFSMAEIDQKPRVMYQAAPIYPSSMRSVEGLVTTIFIVDKDGRVINPRVEKSTHPDFEKPAIDAIKQWKFEPAMKGGQKVSAKMRIPIRFQPKA